MISDRLSVICNRKINETQYPIPNTQYPIPNTQYRTPQGPAPKAGPKRSTLNTFCAFAFFAPLREIRNLRRAMPRAQSLKPRALCIPIFVRKRPQRQVQGTICPVQRPVKITGMARARMLFALFAFALASLSLASDKTIQVTWGTGQHVTAVISYPIGKSKAPTLFIASGRTGGMGTSIIKGLADKAVHDGMIAVRFDYAYVTAKTNPSKGLVDETDQMNAVIEEVMKDPRVDQKKIIIAGKSLGSVVAHRVFSQNNTYLGEVLLTPVIATVEDGQRLYPNLVLSGRPAVLIVGNQDTENAPLGVVYNFLKDASRKIMLDIVAGDHGFELGGNNASANSANALNVDDALNVAEYWVRLIARIQPPAAPDVKVSDKKSK